MSACAATNGRSARSFSVSASIARSVSGTLMPLPLLRLAPPGRTSSTTTTRWSCSTWSMYPPILPSSNQIGSPTRAASKSSGSVQPMRAVASTVRFSGGADVPRVSTMRSPWSIRVTGWVGSIPTIRATSPVGSFGHDSSVPLVKYVVFEQESSQPASADSSTVQRRRDPRASTSSTRSPGDRRVNHAASSTCIVGVPVVEARSEPVRRIDAGVTTRPKASRSGFARITAGPSGQRRGAQLGTAEIHRDQDCVVVAAIDGRGRSSSTMRRRRHGRN